MTDHTHPEFEDGLKRATDILLDIRTLLNTRLGAIEVRMGALESRIGALEARFARIERILDERLGRNGSSTS